MAVSRLRPGHLLTPMLGCSMASHVRAGPVTGALRTAPATRGGSVAGVIFHTDRGSQDTSGAFAQVCDGVGIRRSLGRVGSSGDNALTESFWQGLKRETVHKKLFSTMCQARLEIFQWLTYHHARRHHNALHSPSPAEFEQQHQRERGVTRAA
ncbi:integrase core domain-containing protein [Streptomyces sp. KMM 9044]|uniref:integrase core domain-containing protein n=1 Tax=Streptomyces sp. KMM 9044 TaxID=2744474 RepID=UPI002151CB88|nr:integrase core domain-containing protein [Streptomyces sp. KMM 9044]WAX78158.1 integrase core domain-containing protein [Streptomyces sp. KMM 9044]